VVRERAERHWWLKNAGFKLVAGKFIFRSKKIGGSRKLNWWLRNFRPLAVGWDLTLKERFFFLKKSCAPKQNGAFGWIYRP
jgi:hypothetical protein